MVQKVDDRALKLAALRTKLANTNLGGGAGFWSPKEGRNIVRILPAVGDMDFFFQVVGRHFFPPDGKKTVYCPRVTSEDSPDFPCPVCDMVDQLKAGNDSASKKMADELYVRRSFWMNVIDRENEKAGPVIYTPGVQVFGFISSLVSDPEYGDICDADEGIDLIIERTGTGIKTEYNVKAKRSSTPLHDDPKQVDAWMKKAKDLSVVELTDDPEEDKDLISGHAVYLYPYDRIMKEYDLDVDLDDDEAPKAKATKRAPKHYEEPEDEEVEEVEEEEDKVVEPAPARKPLTRRLGRSK